jgi:hypothetical protein
MNYRAENPPFGARRIYNKIKPIAVGIPSRVLEAVYPDGRKGLMRVSAMLLHPTIYTTK